VPSSDDDDDGWILSRVRGSVTNNNGFWIGWLDLLALLLQLLLIKSIITAHNRWLPKIRSIPYWTTSVFFYSFSSVVTDLVLIYESVPSSASVVRWITLHSWTLNHDWTTTTNQWGLHSDSELSCEWMTSESITCPPFIPRCEPNTEHYLQQFTLFRVYPLLCRRVNSVAMDVYSGVYSVISGTCLQSRCLAVVICVTIWNTDGMTIGRRERNIPTCR
jgi:hypothetical protein